MKEKLNPSKDLVHKAFKNWHLPMVEEPSIYTEMLSLNAIDNDVDPNAPETIRALINSALTDGLDALETLEKGSPVGSTILRTRFLDKQSTSQVASLIKENEHYVNRTQAKAIEQVAAFLQSREQNYRDSRMSSIASSLTASKYDVLIGRDEEHQQLTQMLLSERSDWLVMLIGMGGIGKTSLVDSVLHSLIPTFFFHDIVQISVETHPLDRREGHDPVRTYEIVLSTLCTKLDSRSHAATVAEQEFLVSQHLKKRKYLVVIDNVEEIGDATLLTEKFSAWANPSKILIASRVRPKSGKFRPLALKDLKEADALTLMRHEADNLHLTDLASEADETLRLIFAHTGGNPYAIKLLIGMLTIWSVPQTIAAIQRGKANRIESMFDHIFKAAWQTLTEPAQEVLMSMSLVGASGASAEQLVEWTALPTDDVLNAIDQLSHQSLIEVYGDVKSRGYGIHRLTETFLQQIIFGAAQGKSGATNYALSPDYLADS